jgi:hypothetical protein
MAWKMGAASAKADKKLSDGRRSTSLDASDALGYPTVTAIGSGCPTDS